jgi:hypothetical protein
MVTPLPEFWSHCVEFYCFYIVLWHLSVFVAPVAMPSVTTSAPHVSSLSIHYYTAMPLLSDCTPLFFPAFVVTELRADCLACLTCLGCAAAELNWAFVRLYSYSYTCVTLQEFWCDLKGMHLVMFIYIDLFLFLFLKAALVGPVHITGFLCKLAMCFGL